MSEETESGSVTPQQEKSPCPSLAPSGASNDEEISLAEFWDMLRRWKWLVAGICVMSTLIAALYAMTIVPVYRVSALVQCREDFGLEALFLLQSRQFFEGFVKEDSLFGNVHKEDYPQGIRMEAELLKDAIFVQNQAFFEFDDDILMRDNDDVLKDKQLLVSIGMDSVDPVRASNVINGMIFFLNRFIRNEAVTDAEKSIAFLDKQLAVRNSLKQVTPPGGIGQQDRRDTGDVHQIIVDGLMREIKVLMHAEIYSDEFALKVYDPAVVPANPYNSNREKKIVLSGFVLGGTIGLFAVFILAVFKRLRLKR